jgi:release factor glutamine methyltransferase
MSLPTIQQALQQASQQLSMHASARLDAEVLLAKVLNKPRSHLHAWPDKQLDEAQTLAFRSWVSRRANGEPVAYLTGEREFWSLSLEVTPDTLIPRPDTEILVEKTLQLLPADQPLKVADLGTGSGAIALALTQERPHWAVYALDRSPACIRVARRNALRTGAGKLRFVLGDWCTAFANASLDAIISNPPYVNTGDPHLQSGDVRFEPRTALLAGEDGLDDIRLLIKDAERVLKSTGYLLLEHAPQQTACIHKLLKEIGFNTISTCCDLAGQERVSSARKAT